MTFRIFVCLFIATMGTVVAAACTSASGRDNTLSHSTSTRIKPVLTAAEAVSPVTPTPMVLPEIDPLPHRPVAKDDIRCYDMTFGAEHKAYWVDELRPGESTLEDLERLAGVAIEEANSSGYWEYRHEGVLLQFQDGILIAKSDPRRLLGAIVLQYGEPEQVIWHIPRRAYHLAKYDTILLYPQAGALFYTERQVTDFGWRTEFEHSLVVPPAKFPEITSQYTADSNDDYQFFTWPCHDMSSQPSSSRRGRPNGRS